MVHKRKESNVVAELLQKETNAHFVNLFTNKIDLKMLVKHLHEKDEFENDGLEIYLFHCSSYLQSITRQY